eukprot:TRINITY_DN8832_c0_g1_i4.p1 TRINITY_DN8832_c0_g1~~TRINITY_DN8832_c0_g1_i4.p1  ORF type:complete len:1351 (+),score=368.45 TRINITY_DN8832_c0_g1_i4:415-4053(+)
MDHSFITIAHAGRSNVHHITVEASGNIVVDFLAAERFISLDGVAFPVHETNVQFGFWQLASDNGLNMFVQNQRAGYASAVWQANAIEAIAFKGPTANGLSHNADHGDDVVELGEWRVGPATNRWFVFSHMSTENGTGAPALAISQDGNVHIGGPNNPGTMPTPPPLDADSPNSIVVGGWVIGQQLANGDRLLINRLGAERVTMVLQKNGAMWVDNTKEVTAADLQEVRFERFFEDPSLDYDTPNAYATRRFGNFVLGSRNDDSFVFSHRNGPAALLTSSSVFAYAERTNGASSSYAHKGPSANVLQLGSWLVGALDFRHFVINRVGADRPQMLIRDDGVVFIDNAQPAGRANTMWPLLLNETDKYIRIGNWLMGAKDNGHFVINRVGAARPQFLLRHDGRTFVTSEGGPVPRAFALVDEPLFNTSVVATSAPFAANQDWLMGTAGFDAFVVTKDSNAAPAMVLRNDLLFVNTMLNQAVPSMALLPTDPAVITLGDWLIGIKNDAFVINTATSAGRDFYPQFAIEASGVLRVKGLASKSPASYLRNTTTTPAGLYLEVGDWLIAQADPGHLVILPSNAALRNTDRPAMLVRHDGTLFTSPVWSDLAQAEKYQLVRTCNYTAEYYDLDLLGSRTCVPLSDSPPGSYVIQEPTQSSDRRYRSCPAGTFTDTINAKDCQDFSVCVDGTSFEAQAPTSSSDRVCQTCSACPSNHHRIDGTCQGTIDSQCNECDTCSPANNTYTQTQCGESTPAVCGDCAVCDGVATYKVANCTASFPGRCEPITTCIASQFEYAKPTLTSDRDCRTCSEGQQLVPFGDVQRCQPCPPGFTDDDRDYQTSCVKLPAGSSAEGTGNSGPVASFACKPGETDADSDSSTRCVKCPVDTYTDVTGTVGSCTAMSDCAPGNEVSGQGSAQQNRECRSCADGTFSSVTNAPSCQAHAVCRGATIEAQAPTVTSDRVCESCPAGTSFVAASSIDNTPDQCVSCPAGTHCPSGSIGSPTNHRCDIGTVGNATSSAFPCVPCDGTTGYSDVRGGAVCKPITSCPADQIEVTASSMSADRVCGPSPNAGNPNPAASSSGDDSNTGLLIGGVLGGVLVLVLLAVAVVTYRKRAAAQHQKASENRHVVAFENPIYDGDDEPDQVGYDNAFGEEPSDDGTGLYDQPQMNQGGEDGYLEAEGAEPDGYLEAEGFHPDGEAEDTGGYLDVDGEEENFGGDGF